MYCVRKVVDDLYWVGGNDHRLALFENIHPIPNGVSYNSYLLLDKKTVLFDTVDWDACRVTWIIWLSIIWSLTTVPALRKFFFVIQR